MKTLGDDEASRCKLVAEIKESILLDTAPKEKTSIKEIFAPSMKLVMTIGIFHCHFTADNRYQLRLFLCPHDF